MKPHTAHKDEFDLALERIELCAPHGLKKFTHWIHSPSARPARVPLGLLCVTASFFWFLPVLGLWMLPLGLLFLAQDVPPLRRPIGRFVLWLERGWQHIHARWRRFRARR